MSCLVVGERVVDKLEPLPEYYVRFHKATWLMKMIWLDYYQRIAGYNYTGGHLPGTVADGKIVTNVGLRHER